MMSESNNKPDVKTTKTDDSGTAATTAAETISDEYMLAEDYDVVPADTFSLDTHNFEDIAVYGKEGCAPWNLSWSGKIVTSRIFKVCSLIIETRCLMLF